MPDPAENESTVLSLVGDIDIASEHDWRRRGADYLAANPELRDVVVDLSQVSFLDSRGMAVLVYLHTNALDRGGSLRLRAVPPRVIKALTIAGLDQVFQLDVA
jgi:anti-anti-sigma factor